MLLMHFAIRSIGAVHWQDCRFPGPVAACSASLTVVEQVAGLSAPVCWGSNIPIQLCILIGLAGAMDLVNLSLMVD